MDRAIFAYTMRRSTYNDKKNFVLSGYRLVLLNGNVPIIIKFETNNKSSHSNA